MVHRPSASVVNVKHFLEECTRTHRLLDIEIKSSAPAHASYPGNSCRQQCSMDSRRELHQFRSVKKRDLGAVCRGGLRRLRCGCGSLATFPTRASALLNSSDSERAIE